MRQDEDITGNKTVIFRRDKESEVIIALFPKVPGYKKSGECCAFKDPNPKQTLYDYLNGMRTNEKVLWGSVPYEYTINHTIPAIEREYIDTIKLLSALGHSMTVKVHEELARPLFRSQPVSA